MTEEQKKTVPKKMTTTAEIITPRVFPLVAFVQTPGITTTIGCLAYYFPPPVSSKIETSSGNELTGVREFKGSLHGEPPVFSLLSVATVNKNELEAATYKCHVQHNSVDIVKTIKNVCVVPPKEPSVQLWQGTCPEISGEIELSCNAYNLTSPRAKFQWYFNDQAKALPEGQSDLGKNPSSFYVMTSTVTISKAEWNNGVRVKCRVTDLDTEKSAEDTIRKCSENFNCLGINVFMVPPSIQDLYISNTARIRCVASNLKDLDGSSSFEWSFTGSSTPLNVQTEDPQLHDNGTNSVSSVLTVSPDIWKTNTEFTCRYKNNKLQTPIITTIKKEKVSTTSQPVVQVIPPSDEEKAKKEMCSIVAIVSNILPKDIYIGWLAKNLEVSKDDCISSELVLDSDGKTWTKYSKLNIQCSDWESGTIYGFVVGHESIPKIFMRRTIDKYSGGCEHTGIKIRADDDDDNDEEEEDTENPWDISTTFMSLFVLSLVYSVTVTLFKVK